MRLHLPSVDASEVLARAKATYGSGEVGAHTSAQPDGKLPSQARSEASAQQQKQEPAFLDA